MPSGYLEVSPYYYQEVLGKDDTAEKYNLGTEMANRETNIAKHK